MTKKIIQVFLLVIALSFIFFSFINTETLHLSEENTPKSIPDSVLFNKAPVLSPEEAMGTFQIEEGFRIELVASEPLIQDPVAMDFDEKGRIWVVEMQSYMPNVYGEGEDQPMSRIVILEDHDQDGKMDHSKVFMDKLVLPRTIAVTRGGIVYAEPPNLWFVENIGDKPGKRVLIDTAYAVGGNVEHQPNGMMRAMDNWFYNAKSKARYKYEHDKWVKEETEFRGQWGITQDDFGRLLYNTNSNQLRGDLVPPNSIVRNPNLSSKVAVNTKIAKNQKVYPIRPTPGINRGYREKMLDDEQRLTVFTAACGPVIYRGDQFPDEYQGNAFVCEPSGNLIKRNILAENGAYVEASHAYENREFLASKDERFRPVSMYNGPDGSLYMVDMYRGIIQHETYVTDYLREQIESRGLEKPIGLGRIYRITYEGDWWDQLLSFFDEPEQPALHEAADEELVEYLFHPNGWWRDEAQQLLVERNHEEIVPALLEVLEEDNDLAKIHALWTLEGMGKYSPDIIKKAIASENPKVVATTLRIGERNINTEYADEILALYEEMMDNRDPHIQLQLAVSLGTFLPSNTAKVMQLLKGQALAHNDDDLMKEAIVSSIYGKENEFLTLLTQNSPQQLTMIPMLKEVILNAEVKDQLKGKDLNKEEKKQFVAGKALYEKTCAGCHQENGKGLVPIAPPLASSEWVTGPETRLIQIVLHGLKGPVTVNGKVYQEPDVQPLMPGLKHNPDFTDDKLAAVLTYIRNAWGNDADPVEPGTVKKIRENTIEREDLYTEKELLQ